MSRKTGKKQSWWIKLIRGGGLALYLIAVLVLLILLFWHYRLIANLRYRIDTMAQAADVAVQAQDVLSTERSMVGQINYAFTFRDERMMRTGVAQSLPNFKASYLYLVVLEGGTDERLQGEVDQLVSETMRLRDLALAGRWDEAEQVREEMIPLIADFETRMEQLALSRRRFANDLQEQFTDYVSRSIQSFFVFVMLLVGLGVVNLLVLRRRAQSGIRLITGAADAVLRGDFEVEMQLPALLEDDPLITRVVRSIETVTHTLAERFRELDKRVKEEHETLEQVLTLVEQGAQITHLSQDVRGPGDLYARIVEGIAQQFDLLHVALYTLDETGDYLVLRSASSEEGKAMVHAHYQVRMGEGVVGYVAQSAEPYIGGEGSELLRLRDEHFPETRAYMVLPLIVRNRVLGVLELRCSRMPNFPRHIVVIMKAVARRVGFMLDNARLYSEVEQSRRELNRLYGEMLAETWRAILSGTGMIGYRYLDEGGIQPVQAWSPEMEEAIERDTMIRRRVGEDVEQVVVPLHARGLTVGVIAAQRIGGWTQQWLETFLQLVSHLETSLESALLFTESQMRAARERALGELSAQFAQAFDMEVLLENAVRELGRRFSLDDVSIFIGPPEEEEMEPAEEAQDGEA